MSTFAQIARGEIRRLKLGYEPVGWLHSASGSTVINYGPVGWLHSATCNAMINLMMLIVFFSGVSGPTIFFGKGFSLPSTIIVQTSLLFWNLLNEFTFKRLHVGLLRPTTV